MFINLSNHPSYKWNDKQIQTAQQQFGEVKDIPFPNIPPSATTEEVQQMVDRYVQQIQQLVKATHRPFAVHVMGEMTFVYNFVKRLHGLDIPCVASTTERNTIDNPDGSKTFKFDFIQFRAYR